MSNLNTKEVLKENPIESVIKDFLIFLETNTDENKIKKEWQEKIEPLWNESKNIFFKNNFSEDYIFIDNKTISSLEQKAMRKYDFINVFTDEYELLSLFSFRFSQIKKQEKIVSDLFPGLVDYLKSDIDEYDNEKNVELKISKGKVIFEKWKIKEDEIALQNVMKEIKDYWNKSSFDFSIDWSNVNLKIPSQKDVSESDKSELIENIVTKKVVPVEVAIGDKRGEIFFSNVDESFSSSYMGFHETKSGKTFVNLIECDKTYEDLSKLGFQMPSRDVFIKAIALQEFSHKVFGATESESEIPSLEAGGLGYLAFRLPNIISKKIKGEKPSGIRYDGMYENYLQALNEVLEEDDDLKKKFEASQGNLVDENKEMKVCSFDGRKMMFDNFPFLFTDEFARKFIEKYKTKVKETSNKYKK